MIQWWLIRTVYSSSWLLIFFCKSLFRMNMEKCSWKYTLPLIRKMINYIHSMIAVIRSKIFMWNLNSDGDEWWDDEWLFFFSSCSLNFLYCPCLFFLKKESRCLYYELPYRWMNKLTEQVEMEALRINETLTMTSFGCRRLLWRIHGEVFPTSSSLVGRSSWGPARRGKGIDGKKEGWCSNR